MYDYLFQHSPGGDCDWMFYVNVKYKQKQLYFVITYKSNPIEGAKFKDYLLATYKLKVSVQ